MRVQKRPAQLLIVNKIPINVSPIFCMCSCVLCSTISCNFNQGIILSSNSFRRDIHSYKLYSELCSLNHLAPVYTLPRSEFVMVLFTYVSACEGKYTANTYKTLKNVTCTYFILVQSNSLKVHKVDDDTYVTGVLNCTASK